VHADYAAIHDTTAMKAKDDLKKAPRCGGPEPCTNGEENASDGRIVPAPRVL